MNTPKPKKAAAGQAESLLPRKLPTQKRAAATVDGILEAAAMLLENGGFDGYTTNAVAQRAGASIGSLYQYFPNKTALTQALIAREDAGLLQALSGLLQLGDGPGLLLDALIDVAIAHQLQRPVLARLLDAEEARLPPSPEKQKMREVLMTIFRRSLGDALLEREPQVPQDLFSIIHGMVDGAGQRGETDAKALAERVGRAVRGYIGSYTR